MSVTVILLDGAAMLFLLSFTGMLPPLDPASLTIVLLTSFYFFLGMTAIGSALSSRRSSWTSALVVIMRRFNLALMIFALFFLVASTVEHGLSRLEFYVSLFILIPPMINWLPLKYCDRRGVAQNGMAPLVNPQVGAS